MEINRIFFGMALVAACLSCSGETAKPLDPQGPQTPGDEPALENGQLVATITDNMETKTAASDMGETYSVTWTGTEKISANGKESQSIEVDAANPKRAVFTFDQVSAPYTCVYPAAACMSVSGTAGTVRELLQGSGKDRQ